MKYSAWSVVFLSLFTLSGCGGGGDSTPAPTFTIQTGNFTGGNISPTSVTVTQGQTASFTVNVDIGFELVSVTGCGGSLTGTTYRTGPITASCSLTAVFNKKSYSVVATATNGGAITPDAVSVPHGDTTTFDITTNAGFAIAGVTGCGGSLAGNRYTTGPVMAACNISASFNLAEYTISAIATGGGAISPGSINVLAGGRAEFVVTANNGFRFKQLDGCDGRFADNKFIVENITNSCAIVAQFNPVDVVEFAEPQLARAVKTALGIPLTDPVSATRLSQLTELDASQIFVSRLDGLQYATGLRYLDVSNNRISDFSILNLLAAEQQVATLATLYLGNNPVTSLPDFARFGALRNLSLERIELDSLPSLSGLNELRYLNVAFNKVSDLTALAGLRLSSLYLSGNPLADSVFTVVSGMPLTTLHVDNTDFKSAERINMLDNLRDFSANYTQLSNLNPLMGLRSLTRLSIYGSQVVDLKPLLNMFPNNNAAIYVGGCFKTRGFARAPAIIQQLTGRGNFVQLFDWAIPYNTGCTTGADVIKDLAVTAKMEDSGLTLDWSLTSNDTGPWRCELHLNLNNQQARVPVKVLEDCHLVRSWLIPELNRDVVEPHLIIDNGLVKSVSRVNAGRVIHSRGLSDPYLDSTDWLQIVAKSNPYLVPYRDAKLRLHLVSATNKTPPLVEAWLRDGTNETPLAVTAPARLPTQKRQASLTESYLVNLPAASAKPGISIVVKVAGYAERVFTPEFAEVNSIDLTIVPLQLGSIIAPVPDNNLIEKSILTVWPFTSVNVTNRQPYTLSAAANLNNNSSMLGELYDLQVAEGGSSYYYGYYTRDMNNDGWGGMAYRPGKTGVGLVPFTDIDFTLSHELGHNLSIQHAPCGNPDGVDTNFPYAGASIGTYGVPRSFNTLLMPDIYKDLMSYCGNEHVSDYNLELAQDYITEEKASGGLHLRTAAAVPNAEGQLARALPANSAGPSAMFYRFELSDYLATPTIVQAMQVAHIPVLKANSRFRVLAEFSQGSPLLVPVEKLVFGHGNGAEQISFAVPLTYQGGTLLSWALYDGQRLVLNEPLSKATMPAANTLAASGVRIEEQAGEVCVFVAGRVDGVSLTLEQQGATTVIALNEPSSQFCRELDGVVAGGYWQLQTRQRLTVQVYKFDR